jgi:hypothetical protein
VEDSWFRVLEAVTTTVVFAIVPVIFPKPVLDISEGPITDDERAAFCRYNYRIILPAILTVLLLMYAWFLALKAVAALFDHRNPGTKFLLQASPVTWAIPAMFLGIVSLPILLQWFSRSVLGGCYGRYQQYCNEREGFNDARFCGWLAALVVIAASVFFGVFVTVFARFSEAGIELGRPLSMRSVFYEYTRVRSIEHEMTNRAPNGKLVWKPHYVIRFDDGESWSTLEGFRDPEPDLEKQIAQFISAKCGQSIVEKP